MTENPQHALLLAYAIEFGLPLLSLLQSIVFCDLEGDENPYAVAYQNTASRVKHVPPDEHVKRRAYPAYMQLRKLF